MQVLTSTPGGAVNNGTDEADDDGAQDLSVAVQQNREAVESAAAQIHARMEVRLAWALISAQRLPGIGSLAASTSAAQHMPQGMNGGMRVYRRLMISEHVVKDVNSSMQCLL